MKVVHSHVCDYMSSHMAVSQTAVVFKREGIMTRIRKPPLGTDKPYPGATSEPCYCLEVYD